MLGIVVFAAAQDLAPAFRGAKPPLLLLFGCFAGIPSAFCAGLFADALGGTPFGCSALYFALAATISRKSARISAAARYAAVAVAAGGYGLWIAAWSGGTVAVRPAVASLLMAVAIAPAMGSALRTARKRIGIDRKEPAA